MKPLTLVLAVTVFGIGAIAFGTAGFHYRRRASEIRLPSPAPIHVWIPEEAEIYPASVVTPGTFSVALGLEEFQQRFPTGGLVAFQYSREEEENLDAASYVIVWNAKPGSGIFYKAFQDVHPPGEWPDVVRIARLELVGGKILAFPHVHTALHDLFQGMYCAATFCGIVAFVSCLFFLSTRLAEKAAKVSPNPTSTSTA